MHRLVGLTPPVLVPSDRVSPTERFRVAEAAMDAERWMERDLAAGARSLRFLDTESRVNWELNRRKRRAKSTRTVALMPKLRFERSVVPLTGIWGL